MKLSVILLLGMLSAGVPACKSRDAQSSALPTAEYVALVSSDAQAETSKGQADFEPRVVRFAWSPPGADAAAYAMTEPEDQHLIAIVGSARTRSFPVVIALHGQPKHGQSPRTYEFRQKVMDVASDLVRRGEVEPLVLALPVFRYGGVNWPAFDLVAFRAKVEALLQKEGIVAGRFYVVGHSGAAGCGGDGLNRAHVMQPAAVGFFDTCIGAGFRDEVRALRKAHVPTLIMHSVETAGVVPRRLREYDGNYDYGPVYALAGLGPGECPKHLPDAPLRSQPYRCASDPDGISRALIVDTGEGQKAHEAVVVVGLAYFLREYLPVAR
jgi:hypothetical protein